MRSLLALGVLAAAAPVAAAPAGVELAAEPLAGPYQNPEAVAGKRETTQRMERELPELEAGAPLTEVVPLRVEHAPDGDGAATWHIAIRVTGAEWYVTAPLGLSEPGDHVCSVEDMQRVGPRIAIRYRCLDGHFGWSEETGMLLCGLDRHHRVACGRVVLGDRSGEAPDGKPGWREVVHDRIACKVTGMTGDAMTLADAPPVVHLDEPRHVLTELAACPPTVLVHIDGERGIHVPPRKLKP